MAHPLRVTLSSACLSLLGAALLCAPVRGQWTSDAAANTPVSTAAGDQGQPKLVPAEGGGVWVSWFDGIGTGWDLRAQRLDIGGEAQLPAGGVLVADRPFSSTQDYGLATAADGGALLSFRDDDGAGVFIAANKLAPDGSLSWGPDGVALTGSAAFVASPRIAGTDDGRALVAWTHDSNVLLRRLASDGAIVGAPIAFTPGVGSYSVADMHAVGDDVIISFVHQLGGFGSPRHLLTQKIDAAGGLSWGPAHVSVFDGGSLQFGNFPTFTTDGAGGGVFSWYDAGSLQLQCYAQRVLSDGSEAWAHNGVPVSTDVSQVRVNPSAYHDPVFDQTVVTWIEQNTSQSQDGVYAQKLSAAGARLWTDQGVALVPFGAADLGSPLCLGMDGLGPGDRRIFVTWAAAASFGQDVLRGAMLDLGGVMLGGVFDVASTPSSKSRLALSTTGGGHAAMVWSDERSDGGDIYAQSVHADASLGPRWEVLGGGTVGLDGVPLLTCSGSLVTASELGVSLDHAQPGGLALLWISFASAPVNYFGGTIHALPVGFELLVVNDGSGSFAATTPFPAGVPSGTELVLQFLCQDDSAPFHKTLSDALRGTTP